MTAGRLERLLDDSQDHRRVAFIKASLRDLGLAITDDMDVRGYLHCRLPGVDGVTWSRSVSPPRAVPGGIARAGGIG